MKIRLDDVMQSLSFPFNAVYYYYIPLETVLMFMDGMIYGKAVYGISSEEESTVRILSSFPILAKKDAGKSCWAI